MAKLLTDGPAEEICMMCHEVLNGCLCSTKGKQASDSAQLECSVFLNWRELGLNLEVAHEATTLAVPIDGVMHI